jgi:hypothetical protein
MSRGKRFESARRLSLCPSINSILTTEKVSDARVGAGNSRATVAATSGGI